MSNYPNVRCIQEVRVTLPWALFLSNTSEIKEQISQLKQVFEYIMMSTSLQVYTDECLGKVFPMKVATITK